PAWPATVTAARARLRPAGQAAPPPRTLRDPSGQRGLGGGRAAGKALADVQGRPAVDEVLAGKQRHLLGRTEGDDRVGLETPERGLRNRILRRADHGQLARRRQVEIECAEGVAERARCLPERVADGTE